MRVGERRRLVVPPSLSRRSVYPDSIRPEDTLYYDVVLLQVTDPEK
jgi:FKBP-type peptidyl-prolyl cis-trans isomerase